MIPERGTVFYIKATEIGGLLIEGKNKRLKMMSYNGAIKELDGHKVWVVNASLEQSDLGSYLVNQVTDEGEFLCDYAVIWRYNENNKVVYVSLRSRKAGVDVSKIAKEWNGGGHYCASGFEATFQEFDKFLEGGLMFDSVARAEMLRTKEKKLPDVQRLLDTHGLKDVVVGYNHTEFVLTPSTTREEELLMADSVFMEYLRYVADCPIIVSGVVQCDCY